MLSPVAPVRACGMTKPHGRSSTGAPGFLVLAWRRPEHVTRCLEHLREAGVSSVYVNVDGPRLDCRGDLESVSKCRNAVLACSDWFPDFHVRLNDTNGGLNVGVTSALAWFFAQVNQGYVIEDDVLVDPRSLPYANELISFLDHPRVSSVTLFNIVPARHVSSPVLSARLSRWPSSQYWATSAEKWAQVPDSLEHWREFISPAQLSRVGGRSFAKYWEAALDKAIRENAVSWEHRWLVANWAHEWMTLVSNTNHSVNIGFDRSASSITSRPRWFPISYQNPPEIKRFTESLAPDSKADKWAIRQGLGLGIRKSLKRFVRESMKFARAD